MTNKYKLYTKDGRLLYFKSHQERLKFVNKEKKKELKEMNKRIPVVLKTPTHSVVSAPDHTQEEYYSAAENGQVIIFDNEGDFDRYLLRERKLIEAHLKAKSLLQEYDEEGTPIWKMPRQAPAEKYNVVIDKATQLYLTYEIIS